MELRHGTSSDQLRKSETSGLCQEVSLADRSPNGACVAQVRGVDSWSGQKVGGSRSDAKASSGPRSRAEMRGLR